MTRRAVSGRMAAWRNVLVAAINAGLQERLFGLQPGENWWPGYSSEKVDRGFVYRFEVEGCPGIAWLRDVGFNELIFHAALWPTHDADKWITSLPLSFLSGECVAYGWLERQDGRWLQTASRPVFVCRSRRKETVMALSVRPQGYADHGKFVL